MSVPIGETVNNRRFFLKSVGILSGTAMAGVTLPRVQQAQSGSKAKDTPPSWPRPYALLDPLHSADLAYAVFPEGKCCFASFTGMVRNLAEIIGEPYTSFPVDMMKFGEGGITGWGTVCGTINGASAAINLVCGFENAAPLINEILAWYGATELPIYVPSGGSPLVANISNSQLCHVSVNKWCDRSGLTATSNERKERCRRLAADVAQKGTELLNSLYNGTFVSQNGPAASVSECMTCHGPNVMNNSLGKMDCVSCHEPHSTLPFASDWGKSSSGCDLIPDGQVDERDLLRFLELMPK